MKLEAEGHVSQSLNHSFMDGDFIKDKPDL